MASKVTKQELLKSEYKILATRDPEIFFEAMLIDLRDNTMEPLDNKRLARQQLVFKQWFRQYDKQLRHELITELGAFKESYKAGFGAGKLHMLKHLPMRHTLFGRRIDTKAILTLIRELEA